MPVPHEKVVLVDIAMPETKLVQPAQGSLAVVRVPWLRVSRVLQSLHYKANHASVPTLSEITQKLGADAAVSDPLIGGRLVL